MIDNAFLFYVTPFRHDTLFLAKNLPSRLLAKLDARSKQQHEVHRAGANDSLWQDASTPNSVYLSNTFDRHNQRLEGEKWYHVLPKEGSLGYHFFVTLQANNSQSVRVDWDLE